jgi:hypothetical protein
MDGFVCDECREIYRELREAQRANAERRHDEPHEIEDWVRGLDEEECARIRQSSPLWKAWRRLQEHRQRTGHMISVLPVPPKALSNPN